MTYRDFQIPKKNGFRKISAPSPALLRAQHSLLSELNLVLDAISKTENLDNIIHGFRNNHNAVTAAILHIGYSTTLMMDISNFFNSVTKEHFSHLNINLPEYVFHQEGYTAQGFATSPILANIAIIPALKEINSYLLSLNITYSFTIYADDIQISTDINDVEFQIFVLAKKVKEILHRHRFSLNTNKTRIAYAHYGFRRILGISVGEFAIQPTRKIKRKIRAARHCKNIPSLGGLTNWANLRLPKAY